MMSFQPESVGRHFFFSDLELLCSSYSIHSGLFVQYAAD